MKDRLLGPPTSSITGNTVGRGTSVLEAWRCSLTPMLAVLSAHEEPASVLLGVFFLTVLSQCQR